MIKKITALLFVVFVCVAARAANAADLLLGAGDVVRVSVFGNPDLALETKISEDGKITYPLVGLVDVKDLSPAQAEARIAGLLERGGFIKHAQVNVMVTSFQSQQVSVLGSVNRPGRYPMDGQRNLIDMIALAGGVNPDGGDVISVIRRRDGKPVQQTVDLAAMVRTADMSKNLELKGGDVIYVERAPRFYIYGEVQHPGVYRLERNMTVVQALSAGGGLSARGTVRGVEIKRRDGDGNTVALKPGLDDPLQVDDVVYVRESLF